MAHFSWGVTRCAAAYRLLSLPKGLLGTGDRREWAEMTGFDRKIKISLPSLELAEGPAMTSLPCQDAIALLLPAVVLYGLRGYHVTVGFPGQVAGDC